MSQVKATEIEGDVSVLRHVTVGGSTRVRGSLTVSHNVRIEGWLDAPNIKGVNKGLYETEALLKEAYPEPEAGWFAFVGTSLPASVYAVKEGKWYSTGGVGGSVTVESVALTDSVEDLESRMMKAETELTEHDTVINSVRDEVIRMEDESNTAGNFVKLGTGGKVPDGLIPDTVERRLEFDTIAEASTEIVQDVSPISANDAVPASLESAGDISGGTPTLIVGLAYHAGQGVFCRRFNGKYYSRWNLSEAEASCLGEATDYGYQGKEGVIYVYGKEFYRWNGEALTKVVNSDGRLTEVVALEATKGKASGIAPLDSEGQVPAKHLKKAQDVIIFDSWLPVNGGVTVVKEHTTDEGIVRFTGKEFVLQTTETEAYTSWPGCEFYGVIKEGAAVNGPTPFGNKLYLETSTRTLSILRLNTLMQIGLQIGEDEGTAYDAALGLALEMKVKTLEGSKGAAGGIAPLNANGVIDEGYLSEAMDVRGFGGIVGEAVDVVDGMASVRGTVIYLSKQEGGAVFALYAGGQYYSRWLNCAAWGSQTAGGVKPVANKLYIDTRTNRLYRAGDDGGLVEVGLTVGDVETIVERLLAQRESNS